jgi:hypothetical protein
VNCLYCGKDIGALRLLRDSEFCSTPHRTSYKNRLGRVLNRIANSEAPPPPAAGFLVAMTAVAGNISPALIPWVSTGRDYPVRTSSWVPGVIDTDADRGQEITEQTPALSVAWMSGGRPEPAERWIEWSLAAPYVGFATALAPAFAMEIPKRASVPALCTWAAAAAAEPVARLAMPWHADETACATNAARLPAMMGQAFSLPRPLEAAFLQGPSSVPADEPAAQLVEPSTGETACAINAARLPSMVSQAFSLPRPLAGAFLEGSSLVPAAEPVACFVQPSIVEETLVTAAATEPGFTLTAELEPLPIVDAAFDPPALCAQWMPVPLAEPVWSHVSSSNAAELRIPIAHTVPLLAAAVAGRYVPIATSLRAIPQAEPVMAGVWPHVADTPISNIGSPATICLPQIGEVAVSHELVLQASAEGSLAAEPVETLLVASEAALPLAIAASLRAPEIGAISTFVPMPATAPACAGLEAEAVETLLVAAWAGPISSPAPLRFQSFQVAGSTEGSVAGLDQPRIAATAAAPAPASGKVLVLRPISTIQVTAPEPQHQAPVPAIPRPGMVAVEYHIQRTRSAVFARPEWKSPRFEPLAPRFGLRPVFDKLEDTIKPKAKPVGVFAMPAPRRAHSAVLDYALRAAAAVMLATALWLVGGALKSGRTTVARQDEPSFAAPNHTLTADSQSANSKAESKGPVNWVRNTIASRASVQVADDFKNGMKSWGADAAQYPAGWQRSPDGYVQTGALAIFKPTVKFSDYRLEFFGQIENKSVGWAVRARDEKNYHAMKFTVVEAGLRPIIAMVHYNVVDGKAGRKIQTPLNVMVHNNRPMQVAVSVRGTHLVTSINGEEVDTFSDDAFAKGGVGFFSEAGERARLYWTKVTKNDDWLGHMCAFLSGESSATAELLPPSAPGGTRAPWSPAGDDNSTLAAAWIGLPYLRRTHTRRQRRCNR